MTSLSASAWGVQAVVSHSRADICISFMNYSLDNIFLVPFADFTLLSKNWNRAP